MSGNFSLSDSEPSGRASGASQEFATSIAEEETFTSPDEREECGEPESAAVPDDEIMV